MTKLCNETAKNATQEVTLPVLSTGSGSVMVRRSEANTQPVARRNRSWSMSVISTTTTLLVFLVVGPLCSLPVVQPFSFSNAPFSSRKSAASRRGWTTRSDCTGATTVAKEKNKRAASTSRLWLASQDDGGQADFKKQWEAMSNQSGNQQPGASESPPGGEEDSAEPQQPTVDLNKQWDAFSKNKDQAAEKAERERASKRERLMDWVSGSNSPPAENKPPPTMIQPIPLQPEPEEPTESSSVESIDPPRVKAKFDSLFAGMPSMSEILSGETIDTDDDEEEDEPEIDPSISSRRPRRKRDESWFEAERQSIIVRYDEILRKTLVELEDQKRLDPDTFPENAEEMMKDVLKQEMDTEISTTKERLAQQDLLAYEQNALAGVENKDISGAPDESVQRLIDESEAEFAQQEANRLEIDEFRQYETEALQRAATEQVIVPEKGANLDQWALERLQAMADQRLDVEGEEMVVDLLEDSVDDLRQRIENEANRGSVEPVTMKEWQMYRSIATRLASQDAENRGGSRDSNAAREERILQQLDSWKSYIEKEDVTRKQSGLSRGPKLPFAWQESWNDPESQDSDAPAPVDGRSRSEVRRDLNEMSLKALESLLVNSDAGRREKLQKEIDYLKANMDSDVVPDDGKNDNNAGPVDISDVFSSYSEEAEKAAPVSASPIASNDPPSAKSAPPLQPPVTPFFSDTAGVPEDAALPATPFFSEDAAKTAPPPSTPFFAEAGKGKTEDVVLEGVKLGSMDEQKLQAMFRRAGARTASEQEKIRSEWESFQELEKKSREQSGLSNEEGSDLSGSRDFNVSEVMLEDGDFDAAKILASIGPRPTRRKGSGTAAERPNQEATPDSERSLSLESTIDSEEIVGSLYRAVSAVGGGRDKDDPKAKASFAEYLKKEDELRESLDTLDEEVRSEITEPDPSFNDVEYAEDALASLGERPVRKRTRILDEGGYSDMGGILSSEDDSDDDDEELDSPRDTVESEQGRIDELATDMPDWLREENANAASPRKSFSGSDIDEVFEDDDYEKNARQLAEYERRRAGNDRQMGIDITDVLGTGETDDYADYKFDEDYLRGRHNNAGWGSASFEARKANLVDYTELDISEVNALMDHKDSVYSTGVSQYMLRINKPFMDFGAIFRLEGVLVDITGLQQEAWNKVAEKQGFKVPEVGDVRRASVTRAEIAVREVFGWTDDFIQCGEIATQHRAALREVFDSWMKANAIVAPVPTTEAGGQGSLAMGAELFSEVPEQPAVQVAPRSESDVLDITNKAWSQTATTFGLDAPTLDEVLYAATLGPDLAVREAFRWTADPVEVDKISQSYRAILSSLSGNEPGQASGTTPGPVESNQARQTTLSEGELMEIQFMAWTSVAESFGFEPPLPDEVLAASVIGDIEVAVKDGFEWTEDPQVVSDVVGAFRARVAEMIDGKAPGAGSQMQPKAMQYQEGETTLQPDTRASPTDAGSGATQAELVQMHQSAWNFAVESTSFECPPLDQIQLAMNMDPNEAITRLFRWTEDDQQVKTLSSTFLGALKNESASLIQKYQLKPEVQAAQPATPAPVQGPSADEIFTIALEAWESTAQKNGFAKPDNEQVLFALSVGPEEAVVTGFGWADDEGTVSDLVTTYKEELRVRREKLWHGSGGLPQPSASLQTDATAPIFEVVPNTATWVKSLLDVEMQCGIVSYLDRDHVDVLLEQAGLSELIPPDKRVSATNRYNRDSYQLLGAALRLERRPDHCVVFDSSPYSSVAAHDNDMRSVCIPGPYPRYELLTADTTTNSIEDLTAMNIRRLFGERVYDQPLLETQQTQPLTQKKVKTLYWDDE